MTKPTGNLLYGPTSGQLLYGSVSDSLLYGGLYNKPFASSTEFTLARKKVIIASDFEDGIYSAATYHSLVSGMYNDLYTSTMKWNYRPSYFRGSVGDQSYYLDGIEVSFSASMSTIINQTIANRGNITSVSIGGTLCSGYYLNGIPEFFRINGGIRISFLVTPTSYFPNITYGSDIMDSPTVLYLSWGQINAARIAAGATNPNSDVRTYYNLPESCVEAIKNAPANFSIFIGISPVISSIPYLGMPAYGNQWEVMSNGELYRLRIERS